MVQASPLLAGSRMPAASGGGFDCLSERPQVLTF